MNDRKYPANIVLKREDYATFEEFKEARRKSKKMLRTYMRGEIVAFGSHKKEGK